MPLQASITYSSGLSGVDVRTVAKRWVERTIPAGSVIAAEPYGPPLVERVGSHPLRRGRVAADRLPRGRPPAAASRTRPTADARARYLERHDVRYVIVSSQVYDRVLAASDHYPTQERFYRHLSRPGEARQDLPAGTGAARGR